MRVHRDGTVTTSRFLSKREVYAANEVQRNVLEVEVIHVEYYQLSRDANVSVRNLFSPYAKYEMHM